MIHIAFYIFFCYYQNNYAIAIGSEAGGYGGSPGASQGTYSIAIGYNAARYAQGSNSIAFGSLAGNYQQANNSIILNATGAELNSTIANSLFVKPIRDVTAESGFTVQLYYNPTTGEIGYK